MAITEMERLVEGRKCATERETWTCPNMRGVDGDLSMDYEYYECKVCGRTMKLDYEEMK